MSPVKKIVIALGVVLTLTGGFSSMSEGPAEVQPIVIAREAEAVARGLRIWLKRPVPGLIPSASPSSQGVVACDMHLEHTTA